jgi:hypothetical protein
MSLLSYKEAPPRARSIREKVLSREMPPWHADPKVGQFSNDPRLTQAEIDTITAWVDGDAKEGEPTYDEMVTDIIGYTADAQSLKPAVARGAGGGTQK